MTKEKITYYIKALRFFLYPLYFISFLVPKKNTIWVFGAHQNRFSENSKSLFLYVSNNNTNIQAVWISGDKKLSHSLQKKGLNSFYKWSIKGLYLSLRAKYYFYNVYSDDINFYTSGNTTLVNLWHGIPLKKIEFDDKDGALSRQFNSKYSFIYSFFKPYNFIRPNYVLSTSKIVSQKLASAFRITEDKCLEFGYPRNDIFYEENTLIQKNLISSFNIDDEKIIFYLPTWRNNNINIISSAFPNLDELNTTLQASNIKLFIKLHPNDTTVNYQHSNILYLNSQQDLNELLLVSDYLITDYSSVYFDYLHLNKEIIFYPFDYDTYVDKERKFYFEYELATPGIKVKNFQELVKTLSNLETLNYEKTRQKLKNELWTYQDNNASKRIMQHFEKRLIQ